MSNRAGSCHYGSAFFVQKIFCGDQQIDNVYDVKSIEKYEFPENEYIYWWIYLLGKKVKRKRFFEDNIYDVEPLET